MSNDNAKQTDIGDDGNDSIDTSLIMSALNATDETSERPKKTIIRVHETDLDIIDDKSISSVIVDSMTLKNDTPNAVYGLAIEALLLMRDIVSDEASKYAHRQEIIENKYEEQDTDPLIIALRSAEPVIDMNDEDTRIKYADVINNDSLDGADHGIRFELVSSAPTIPNNAEKTVLFADIRKGGGLNDATVGIDSDAPSSILLIVLRAIITMRDAISRVVAERLNRDDLIEHGGDDESYHTLADVFIDSTPR